MHNQSVPECVCVCRPFCRFALKNVLTGSCVQGHLAPARRNPHVSLSLCSCVWCVFVIAAKTGSSEAAPSSCTTTTSTHTHTHTRTTSSILVLFRSPYSDPFLLIFSLSLSSCHHSFRSIFGVRRLLLLLAERDVTRKKINKFPATVCPLFIYFFFCSTGSFGRINYTRTDVDAHYCIK